jgi:hypothetical protein
MLSFQCSICGKVHDEIPQVGTDRPDPWWGIPAEERTRRIELTSESCIIDDDEFFIRGVIEIPIHGHPDPFGFGVWVSQKKENFFQYLEKPDSAEIGPFFGWLCTRVAFYQEDTFLLKTMAHFRDGNIRPAIELQPTDHPLAIDQRNGISQEKAWEIVHFYMKPDIQRVNGSATVSEQGDSFRAEPLNHGIGREGNAKANDWPFDQPRNCAVITLRQILEGMEPILHVTHDLDDHGWQFLGRGDAQLDDAAVVLFENIVGRDGSLRELADLPPGWRAWRRSVDEAWTREPNPTSDDA